MRVDPAELRALRLRAHELLSDAPLHDVWCFRLRGGGPGITVPDVIDLFVDIDEILGKRETISVNCFCILSDSLMCEL